MRPHQRTPVKFALLALLLAAADYDTSITKLEKELSAKLEKELSAKRMIGLFLGPVFPSYVISPLGLRNKKVPCKFRVIHDLSAPYEGISVNSCIPTRDGTVTYDTVDMTIQLIQRTRQGAILAKTDIAELARRTNKPTVLLHRGVRSTFY